MNDVPLVDELVGSMAGMFDPPRGSCVSVMCRQIAWCGIVKWRRFLQRGIAVSSDVGNCAVLVLSPNASVPLFDDRMYELALGVLFAVAYMTGPCAVRLSSMV